MSFRFLKFKFNTKHFIGRIGEIITVVFYLCTLHSVLGYRVRNQSGEIDIIFQRFKTIVFVEVKTRRSLKYDNMLLSIEQQNRIKNAAQIFIASNQQYHHFNLRFDLVIVRYYVFPQIIRNAW